MPSSLIYNSTFKCYKLTSATAPKESFKDVLDHEFTAQIKSQVVRYIVREMQSRRQDGLLFNDAIDEAGTYDAQELAQMIRVDRKYEEVDAGRYRINYVSVRSSEPRVLKPQLFVFITDQDSEKKYNTLFMVRALPKISNVVIRHLVNEQGILLDPLRIPSEMLVRCLDSNMAKLLAMQSDLIVSFGKFNTIGNSLSAITLRLGPDDLKSLHRDESVPFCQSLFAHLKENTAISFDKLELTKIQCDLFNLNSDAKVKLFKDPGSNDDTEVSWSVLQELL